MPAFHPFTPFIDNPAPLLYKTVKIGPACPASFSPFFCAGKRRIQALPAPKNKKRKEEKMKEKSKGIKENKKAPQKTLKEKRKLKKEKKNK